ncbi:unnamed protein product [Adineta ricciae]|uniref:Uncharacterized protein n=1 Tax=Adineta ricciae TaxID=249248 RepID=A0A815KXE4_ADIRI|nr:unnamed protein product [Adineta ricciae]
MNYKNGALFYFLFIVLIGIVAGNKLAAAFDIQLEENEIVMENLRDHGCNGPHNYHHFFCQGYCRSVGYAGGHCSKRFQYKELVFFCQWTIIIGQLNLYDTQLITTDDSLQFNCLKYYVRVEKPAYQDLVYVTDELIPYCFRLTNETNLKIQTNFLNPHSQTLTFDDLRRTNITSQQLLLWSVSIDLAERYQFYLDKLDWSLNEQFYNCSNGWFGNRCQYVFEQNTIMSIEQIVEIQFHSRTTYEESTNIATELSCYIHLPCDRGGGKLCLDWREICDGHVDCLNRGVDEALCFEMEINECNEDEFRCYNGQCIPHTFRKNHIDTTDCLDRSDESFDANIIDSCFQDPTFRCEEHSCRSDANRFVCGDGQCVEKFHKCHNGRHALLRETMAIKGNLSDNCWIAMVCLTSLRAKINNISCKSLLVNGVIFQFLKDCDPLFQFPGIPIYHNHIRFLYSRYQWLQNSSDFFWPQYICYDQQLCDAIKPIYLYENVSCINGTELHDIYSNTDEDPWFNMNFPIGFLFRGCILTHGNIHSNEMIYQEHSSLYSCKNSLKRISKHRIKDNIYDCYLMDDENYNESCALNDRHRTRCADDDICLAPFLSASYCPSVIDQYEERHSFHDLCQKMWLDEESNNQTDLYDFTCSSQWPCKNMYTQCDGLRDCEDGQDEQNCAQQTLCDLKTQECISPLNFTVICLPLEQVDNKQDDCLGASDELQLCRSKYLGGNSSRWFRCRNISKCLLWTHLCDNHLDCPEGDDEIFCNNRKLSCDASSISNWTVAQVLCRINEIQMHRTKYFSIYTSSNYPSLESDLSPWIIEQRFVEEKKEFFGKNVSWPWYCNRGLHFYELIELNTINDQCICSPSYYGNLCQYQNQRVSLTMQVIAYKNELIYSIIIMLIDEEQTINSHEQFVYIPKQSCSITLNRYLLYSTRPKDILKKYSLRIDVFNKHNLNYIGSWHYPIPFLFLPVNRVVIDLFIIEHLDSTSSDCSRKCYHGECMKYFNTNTTFCRCHESWSGIDCNMKINCQNCSSDSLCIGFVNNRPICICPLTKHGPRCLLTSLCVPNACENDGQCVPNHVNGLENTYNCICSSSYFGTRCQYMKGKIEVSLNDIDIPSFALAYFFTLSNESEPTITIVLQKLTLFQRFVTFHISIPFHLMIVEVNEKFYLTIIQQLPRKEISTSIDFKRECFSLDILMNSTMLEMKRIQRIKYYHHLCEIYHHLQCFIDETYLCLCTNDRHANCLTFHRHLNLQCTSKDSCENHAKCIQDHPICSNARICVCSSCFYGDRCQYYTKGFGVTLDEIIGFEIRRNKNIFNQPFSVQLSLLLTICMFIIGMFNSILAIFTFNRKRCQEVGCGIYLFYSSITSLLIVILLICRIWFLFLSHMIYSHRYHLAITSCFGIEIPLKILLYLHNWYNSCVAIERTWAVSTGISFNKKISRRLAKIIVHILPIVIVILMIPQFIHFSIFFDEKEDRTWCVINYRPWLQIYNLIIICFHFLGPLLINFFSSIYIIVSTAYQRAMIHTDDHFLRHFHIKLKQYRHLLISPMILATLSLFHIGIIFSMDCKKSSRYLWFHLLGYFISFLPSVFGFIIFVLPSKIYRKVFSMGSKHFRKQLSSYYCHR